MHKPHCPGGNSLHLHGENCCSPRVLLHCLFPLTTTGPTVLEVFNTLLRQLRLSIDYALTGSYDCGAGVSTKIIKEHEERMFQEAVIKTIGWCPAVLHEGAGGWPPLCGRFLP